MPVIARNFGHPTGLIGHFIGRLLARSNGPFNRWAVAQLANHSHDHPIARIVELGPGPGIALAELLRAFPEAAVWGIDPSQEMLALAGRRNRLQLESGRLNLIAGDAGALAQLAPVDLVLANFVLYFWPDPAAELRRIGAALGAGGRLALGYQLTADMPAPARRDFPREGFGLYDNQEEVTSLLRDAGFTAVEQLVRGPNDRPGGRLAVAVKPATAS